MRDLTAALDALYAALPLIKIDVPNNARSSNQTVAGQTMSRFRKQNVTHGGFVIPCLDPVLMIIAWFS